MRKILMTIMALFIFCACGQADFGGVEGDLQEEPIESSNQISVQKALCANGELYTFHFDYAYEDVKIEVAVSIEDTSGTIIQEFDFVSIVHLVLSDEVVRNKLLDENNFVDFNFDGYLDFRCVGSEMGRARTYSGWIWDADAGLFREIDLSEIVNMWVSEQDQTVQGGFYGAGGYTLNVYRFQDDHFVETNRLSVGYFGPFDSETSEVTGNYWVEDGHAYMFNEYHLVDGELVEVWPDMICDTEEGLALIREHFFGIDSIWFPGEQEVASDEAEYFFLNDHHKMITNARFQFAAIIPNSWRAFNRSQNGDGCYIDCGNENIDIRFYGKNYDWTFNNLNTDTDSFVFDNGYVGWVEEEPGASARYYYLNDRNNIITMYVGYEGDEAWFADNYDLVVSTAKSIHDTD